MVACAYHLVSRVHACSCFAVGTIVSGDGGARNLLKKFRIASTRLPLDARSVDWTPIRTLVALHMQTIHELIYSLRTLSTKRVHWTQHAHRTEHKLAERKIVNAIHSCCSFRSRAHTHRPSGLCRNGRGNENRKTYHLSIKCMVKIYNKNLIFLRRAENGTID